MLPLYLVLGRGCSAGLLTDVERTAGLYKYGKEVCVCVVGRRRRKRIVAR